MATHRPLIFSAAHSTLLQEADRQSRQRKLEPSLQPQLLLKRGFYSEGGRAGWGFYLEPAAISPPSDPSSSRLVNGDAERIKDGGEDLVADEDASDARRHGKRRRQTRGSRANGRPSSPQWDELPPSAPTAWGRLIASHGAYFPSCPSPLALRPHPQPPPRLTNSTGGSKASRHGKQDLRNCVALVRYSLPFA